MPTLSCPIAEPALLVRLALSAPIMALTATISAAQADCPGAALTPIRATEHSFTAISSVVHMGGDSLVVADEGEDMVFMVSLASGRPAQVSRKGGGPGEYSRPRVIRGVMPGVLMLYDEGLMRLTLFDHQWKVIESFRTSGVGSFRIRGMDSHRNLFLEDYFSLRTRASVPAHLTGRPAPAVRDSVRILRRNLISGQEEAIATLALPTRRASFGGMIDERPGGMDVWAPFGERDDWTLTADGGVVVVRGGTYTAQWYTPTGALRSTVPLPPSRVPVTIAEQDAWWREAQRDSILDLDCRGGTCKPIRVYRAARPTEWPKIKNPFQYLSLRVAQNGDLWVKRSGSVTDTAVCYDIVDLGGRLRQVRLPLGRTVMAVSSDYAYAKAEDSDGLQFVEEYRTRP